MTTDWQNNKTKIKRKTERDPCCNLNFISYWKYELKWYRTLSYFSWDSSRLPAWLTNQWLTVGLRKWFMVFTPLLLGDFLTTEWPPRAFQTCKGGSLIDCYVAKVNKSCKQTFFKIASRIAYLLRWKRPQAKRLLSSKLWISPNFLTLLTSWNTFSCGAKKNSPAHECKSPSTTLVFPR